MTEQSPTRLWLARAAIAGCILMAAIIVSSAYLRLTSMGIGCEPWPACYGRILASAPSALARSVDVAPTSVRVARLLHRAAAMSVAIIAVLTMLLALVRTARGTADVTLAASILALTIMLAAVGRMSATLLVPAVGVANLLGGFGLLACFWALRLNNRAEARGQEDPPRTLRRAAGVLLFVFTLQAAAGALISVTYSAGLCPSLWVCDAAQAPARSARGFPLFAAQPVDANGKVVAVAAAAGLQTMHRFAGIIIAALFALFGLRLMRLPAARARGALVLALAAIESAIGILMATHDFPLLAALAHNAVAALLLVLLVSLAWPAAAPAEPARSD